MNKEKDKKLEKIVSLFWPLFSLIYYCVFEMMIVVVVTFDPYLDLQYDTRPLVPEYRIAVLFSHMYRWVDRNTQQQDHLDT
jgi:dolichol kinase